MNAPPILFRPVVSLIGWTFLMESWMYKTRIQTIRSKNVQVSPHMSKDEMNKVIPAQVRWKADNYNHLHEAPTRFYAITVILALLHATRSYTGAGAGDLTLETNLAWTYVGLRVVHSLTQAISNTIMVRFSIYILSEVVMLGLFFRVVGLVF